MDRLDSPRRLAYASSRADLKAKVCARPPRLWATRSRKLSRGASNLLAGEKLEVAFRDLVRALHEPSPRAAGIPALHGIEFLSQASIENYWMIDIQLAIPQPKGERKLLAVGDSTVWFSFWKRGHFSIRKYPLARRVEAQAVADLQVLSPRCSFAECIDLVLSDESLYALLCSLAFVVFHGGEPVCWAVCLDGSTQGFSLSPGLSHLNLGNQTGN